MPHNVYAFFLSYVIVKQKCGNGSFFRAKNYCYFELRAVLKPDGRGVAVLSPGTSTDI